MNGDRLALYRIRRYLRLHRQHLIDERRYYTFISGRNVSDIHERRANVLFGFLADLVSAEIEGDARSTNFYIEQEKECIAQYRQLLSEAKERKKQAKTKKQ